MSMPEATVRRLWVLEHEVDQWQIRNEYLPSRRFRRRQHRKSRGWRRHVRRNKELAR